MKFKPFTSGAVLLALFFLLPFLQPFSATAQGRSSQVKGIVKGANNEPLSHVSVVLRNRNANFMSGTVSDTSGIFLFSSVPAGGPYSISLSIAGYEAQTLSGYHLKEGATFSLSVDMKTSTKSMDEVVVVGYGTVKKRDLTGSVVSVKGAELTKVPVTTPMEAVQGKVPGMDMYRDNGYAGGSPNIRIRGTRSINNPSSSNNVLYIVDGVQGVNMADINPNDIQSIEVLKDASSTAIYGSRGANGVIIITTKRGTSGKPKLSFNTYSGVSKVAGYGEFQNGPEYVAFKREAYRAAGVWNSPADDAKVFNPAQLSAIQKGQYVDWQDLLLNKGAQQDYQIGVTGGTDKTKVYFSAGYYHEKGVLKQDEYKRYTGRFNIDQIINNWMKVGISSQLAYIDNDVRRDPFNQASKTPPIGSAFDSAGNFNLWPNGGLDINPLADQQPGQWDRNVKTTRLSAAAYLELTPIKDLSIKSTFSTTQSGQVHGWFYGKNTIDGKGANSQSQVTNNQTSFISWENLLNYKKEFGDHSLTLTGVTSYLQNINTSSFAGGRNQLFESQSFYNIGSATQQPFWGSSYNKYNLLSFTGRANYSYMGKYLLTLTGRSDGSSKLGAGNKWAFFPSAALAWRLSDENFIKERDLFSDLKLRASYGVSGNDVINPYATQNSLTQIPFSYNDATAAIAYGVNPTIGNDQLEWELTATKDFGLDFGLWKNRVSGSVDYYDALTYNLIFPYTLPGSTGVTTVNRNVGKTRNRGIEVGINTQNIVGKDFTWSTNLTFTRNREKIVELPNGNVIHNDYRQSLILGYSPTIYYDYKKIGIWQLGEEAEAAKYQAIPGDIKIADLSGPEGKPDGKIDQADRTFIGTRVPKWTGGFSNDFKYKGFDLNVFFFARVGQWMSSDYYAKFVRNGSQNSSRVDYWTPENPTNAYPRPNYTRSSSYVTTLTEFENSYVKLRNVTLGYTLPKAVSGRFKMDHLRVYVSGKNLGWISNKKDFDPESEGIIDQPLSRLFVAGLNVSF